MKIQRKLNFNANNVFNFVLEPYDGSIESFLTENVIPGRIIFRIDNMQVYVCISSNPVVWQPIIKVADFYEHIQNVNSSLWLLNHNLGTNSVIVQVYDTSNNQVIPEEITIVDKNNVNISFGQMTMTGGAFVIPLNTNIVTLVDRMSLSLDVLKSKVKQWKYNYDTFNRLILTNKLV